MMITYDGVRSIDDDDDMTIGRVVFKYSQVQQAESHDEALGDWAAIRVEAKSRTISSKKEVHQ